MCEPAVQSTEEGCAEVLLEAVCSVGSSPGHRDFQDTNQDPPPVAWKSALMRVWESRSHRVSGSKEAEARR